MKKHTLALSLLLSIATVTTAQAKSDIDASTGVVDKGMVTPTVIDKMIAINQVLGKGKVNWKAVGRGYLSYMNRDNYKDKNVVIPVMMGFRMSDGVLAIMARDVELLNKTAADIEFMANKLGTDGQVFKRAAKVKAFANRGDWSRVFLELGYLQKQVMATLSSEGNKSRKAILIAGGWLEGAHMMTTVIASKYTKDASSLLREPRLVEQMIKDLNNLKPEYKKDILVINMISSLKRIYKIVDIPLHGSISKTNIEGIQKITSAFRKLVIHSKR